MRALRRAGPQARASAAPSTRTDAHPPQALPHARCLSRRQRAVDLAAGGTRQGRLTQAARSGATGSARPQGALRKLTRGGLFERSGPKERGASFAARPWREHRSGVGPKGRPPEQEPLAGTACRERAEPTQSTNQGREIAESGP